MRTKQICLLLSSIIFLLACSLFQRLAPEPGPVEYSKNPSLDPDPSNQGESDSESEAIYELFDESPAPGEFTVVRVGKTREKLLDILKVEAKKAFEMSRVPYVEFYADWCPPCNAIRESLGDERMIDAFAGTYIIKLDLDYWKEKLSGTGFYVRAIPAFYEIDILGKPTGRMITGAAWGEDIPENIAPPMKEFFNGGPGE